MRLAITGWGLWAYFLCLSLLLVGCGQSGVQRVRGFGAESEDEEGEVNLVIHLVPHSNVPRSAEGSDALFEGSVSAILTHVLDQLDNDVKRRFVWAELVMFRRWYENLSQGDKQRVRRAVHDGQLEIVGGGVLEFDEALTTWEAVVEKATLAHNWLENHLGVRPKVAWQIDSAGHSDATPTLLGLMGFEALVLGRVHYRVKQQFKSEKHLEFVWRGQDISGGGPSNSWQGGDIFTHVLYQGFISPEGFDFEGTKGVRQVTNAKRRADRLLHTLRDWATSYRTHHLLVPLGDDLRFLEADKQFTNMEKLIRYINEKVPDVRIQFSTASEYVKSVRKTSAITGLEFPRFVGDMFPYADGKEGYWSGVFSTRQALKAACRDIEDLVRSTDTFFSLARARATAIGDAPPVKTIADGNVEADLAALSPEWDGELYDELEQARWISAESNSIHAITGAAKVQVVNDLVDRLRRAQISAGRVLVETMAQLVTKRQSDFHVSGPRVRPTLTTIPFSLAEDLAAASAEDGVQGASAVQHPVIVFNPDGWARKRVVYMVVGSIWNDVRHVQVVDSKGNSVNAQLHHQLLLHPKKTNKRKAGKTQADSVNQSSRAPPSRILLSFVVDVPPLGFSTYFVYTSSARERIKKSHLINAATPSTVIHGFRTASILENSTPAPPARSSSKGEVDKPSTPPPTLSDDDYYADEVPPSSTVNRNAGDPTAGAGGAGNMRGAPYRGNDVDDDDDDYHGADLLHRVDEHQRPSGGGIRGGNGNDDDEDIVSETLGDGVEKATTNEKELVLENQFLEVKLAAATGLIHSITDKVTKRVTLLRQQFYSYPGTGSGAFVFNPERAKAVDLGSVMVAVTKGPLFEQAQVIGKNGISQTVRLWKHTGPENMQVSADLRGHIEVVYVITPEVGHDTVVRFETSMDTEGTFYTDNALGQLVKRTAHPDAPLPSSVYPASSTAALRDTVATQVTRMGQLFAIVSKTPFSCASPISETGAGALEVMLHRNHEADDGRGIGEPLSDFTIVEFTSLLTVGTPADVLTRLPHLQHLLQRPGHPLFAVESENFVQIVSSRESWASRFETETSMLMQPLPPSMQLQAIQARDPTSDQVVARFRSVAYGEEKTQPFALKKFFDPSFKVTAFQTCTAAGAPLISSRFAPFRASNKDSSRTSFEYITHPLGLAGEGESREAPNGRGRFMVVPNSINSVILSLVGLADGDVSYQTEQSSRPNGEQNNAAGINSANSGQPLKPAGGASGPAGPAGATNTGGSSQAEGGASASKADQGAQEVTLNGKTKQELEDLVEEHRSEIEFMDRRVNLFKSNIDQLLADVERFEKQGKAQLKERTIEDLKAAELSLEEAKSSLEQSRSDLEEILEQLQAIDHSFRVDDNILEFEDVRQREMEATVHGAVAGAAAMLLFVVAGNWIFSGGFKLVRGYVPISVGFQKNEPGILPTSHAD